MNQNLMLWNRFCYPVNLNFLNKEEIKKNINHICNDLNKLIETNINGAAIKTRWMEFGKKYKAFSSFEKIACRKISIKSLRNAHGTLIDKQEDTLKKIVTFCEYLYSKNQQCCEKVCSDYTKTL